MDINCLIKNTSIVEDLRAAVEMVALDIASTGRKATLNNVYSEIRKAGIEVDLNTVGYVYSEVVPNDSDLFNTREEVEEITGRRMSDTIRKLILSEPGVTEKRIGEMSPEQYVASGIANMFYGQTVENTVDESVAVTLQKAMFKGAKRMLKEVSQEEVPTEKQTYEDVIERALSLETHGYRDLNGKLNNIRDLFEATKAELDKITDEIQNSDNNLLKEQWAEYMNGFENATYSLLFSKKEAGEVLNGIMKEAGYGKELKNGKVILDWGKLAGDINDAAQIRDNVTKVLSEKGYTPEVAEKVAESLSQEYYDLKAKIAERAVANLDQRKNRLEDPVKAEQKPDYKKLAELSALGIFNRNHDSVLFRALGVSELEEEDYRDIQNITETMTRLSAELDGKDASANYAFQTLQRDINKIVARNIKNRTLLLKIVGFIDKAYQMINLGRIMNIYNSLQNNWSGFTELSAVTLQTIRQQGLSQAFKDGKFFRAVWKDISFGGGVTYGDEPNRFSNKEYIGDLFNKVDWKNVSDSKDLARVVGALVTTPGRMFLSASDSANKALLQRKHFMLTMHTALMQKGMSKREANQFLNEALYGQSYAQAETQAKQILEMIGKPVNKNSITRMANDLVIGNLNMDRRIDAGLVEAAWKSSYKVAGIGLGHESNWLARRFEAGKREASIKEQQLIKEENWNALAWHRLYSTMYYSAIRPFTTGITNWMYLRVQSGLGVGILTGFAGGQWNQDIDFSSKETMEKSLHDRSRKRQEIARGINGLMFNAVMFGILLSAIAMARADDDDDYVDAMIALFKEIKGNYFLNKVFLRSASDYVLLAYLFAPSDKEENNGTVMDQAVAKYVTQYFNLGNEYADGVKVARVMDLLGRGNINGARGKAGDILGSKIEFPLYRAYKGYYQVIRGFADKDYKPEWKPPYGFLEGFLGNGMLEDLGVFNRDSPIDALPGIGPKSAERFNKKGIYKMSDLKDYPNWYMMVPAKDRKKARQAYEELYQ